jgi:hypothetical protein
VAYNNYFRHGGQNRRDFKPYPKVARSAELFGPANAAGIFKWLVAEVVAGRMTGKEMQQRIMRGEVTSEIITPVQPAATEPEKRMEECRECHRFFDYMTMEDDPFDGLFTCQECHRQIEARTKWVEMPEDNFRSSGHYADERDFADEGEYVL